MVKVMAHRGASAAAPENTLEAFRLARSLGADWVELDARRTADGRLVVHHNAELPDGRTVCRVPRSELPVSVCDLDEALDACVGMRVNIEIKNIPGEPDFDPTDVVATQVVELVAARSAHGDVLVSCFHRATIDLIQRIEPTVATAMLGYGPSTSWAEWADDLAAAGHRAVHPWYPMIDAAAVQAVHAVGMEVNVWTVNDPEHMVELVRHGVDGLCTDVPDAARRVLDTHA